MCADLVELPMHDFDVIVGMDSLHSCYVCMHCSSRVVRFRFPNKEELICEGYNSSNPNPFILNLKTNKMMPKGLLCHVVSVNNLDHDIPSINLVSVLNEFHDVFLDDFPRVPPS